MTSASIYPFSALVAQDELKLCLMLIAVQPRLGGVLIRGDKGSAKSTAARAIAELLSSAPSQPAPFINLPLGASEDRVVGALDLEHALHGERKLQVGLLAQADGGVLYVDEVNLLADHLVDVLLDAAAMGVNYVERDGLSVEQASRFALIGSMNPEEGGLRPQFLDRFGLCVEVSAPRDTETRAIIVRRRLQFEHDPQSFRAQYADEQETLKGRLKRAQACLRGLTLSDSMLTTIAELCQAANVKSLRADLVLARGALAYAALHGADEVMPEHIEQVAPFVLTHRQADVTPPRPRPPGLPPTQTPVQNPSTSEATDEARADTPDSAGASQSFQSEQTFAIGAPLKTAVPDISSLSTRSGRRKPVVESPHGRITRSVRTSRPQHLAVADSLRYAITRTALSGQDLDTLTSDDLHSYQHQSGRGVRLLLVVDSSGSLAARKRMASVKGLIASMLNKAYQQREEVSLIAFRSTRAECTVPWTRDTNRALAALEALPTGGRTPLAHALELAHSLIENDTETSLILFTDGKSNVPLNPGGDPWQDVLISAERLRDVQTVIVDTEEGNIRLARARKLADALGAEYILLGAPDAQNVT